MVAVFDSSADVDTSSSIVSSGLDLISSSSFVSIFDSILGSYRCQLAYKSSFYTFFVCTRLLLISFES
jgi:hypothetical protein